MCVGERIHSYLVETGRSQSWLSGKANISKVKLNLSLHGKRKFTFEEYARICGALDVNTDKFIIPKVPPTTEDPRSA